MQALAAAGATTGEYIDFFHSVIEANVVDIHGNRNNTNNVLIYFILDFIKHFRYKREDMEMDDNDASYFKHANNIDIHAVEGEGEGQDAIIQREDLWYAKVMTYKRKEMLKITTWDYYFAASNILRKLGNRHGNLLPQRMLLIMRFVFQAATALSKDIDHSNSSSAEGEAGAMARLLHVPIGDAKALEGKLDLWRCLYAIVLSVYDLRLLQRPSELQQLADNIREHIRIGRILVILNKLASSVIQSQEHVNVNIHVPVHGTLSSLQLSTSESLVVDRYMRILTASSRGRGKNSYWREEALLPERIEALLLSAVIADACIDADSAAAAKRPRLSTPSSNACGSRCPICASSIGFEIDLDIEMNMDCEYAYCTLCDIRLERCNFTYEVMVPSPPLLTSTSTRAREEAPSSLFCGRCKSYFRNVNPGESRGQYSILFKGEDMYSCCYCTMRLKGVLNKAN